MQESDLNLSIEKSLDSLFNKQITEDLSQNITYKIPDPSKVDVYTTSKRPFDGISYNKNFVVIWEAKFIKGYQAFNFEKIKPHQHDNLMKGVYLSREASYKFYPLLVIGIWESRKYYDVYFFDYSYILNLKSMNKKSILKKDFLNIYDKRMTIKKGMIQDIELLENMIIR